MSMRMFLGSASGPVDVCRTTMFKDDNELKTFCDDLIINNTNFRSLQMRYFELSSSQVTILVKALASAKNVQSLDFVSTGLDDKSVAAIADLVKKRNDVKSLSLGCNKITAKGVEAIAKAIKGSPITEINLNDNLVGDKSAPILASMIKDGQALEKINLANNGFTAFGIGILLIAKALKGHQSLKEIDLTIVKGELDNYKGALLEVIQSSKNHLNIIVTYECGAYSLADIEALEAECPRFGN